MLEETAAGIEKHLGKKIMTRAMTIREPDEVKALLDETWERFDRLDVLVNSAGGQYPQAAIDFSVKGWNAVIDTNLNGSWYMMQNAALHWRAPPGAASCAPSNLLWKTASSRVWPRPRHRQTWISSSLPTTTPAPPIGHGRQAPAGNWRSSQGKR
jgi:NAD(P)-dependent dehydrogenase (short-subunit alcohol dehydrogenase family)